ncbi:hypothetical protein [Methylobacterium pseudosasicola]|uniref:Uncharacterized protein n=1 Tax=Methylobacterium pseudosasicola TaxID=582667 RepID=A0A1I4NCA8_9HYPH|nr:hypothetical protein [Methylobacterium pseudosasicola]SFM13202.1 hypothetical protein SAMN05192568_102052 [Methylobacterium pseudosasicola]
MLLNALVLLASLTPALENRAAALLAAPPVATAPAEAAPPRFDPATRSVSNWHEQAGAFLLPRALALTARLAEDPPYVARCVRLNNGWCIKSAHWPGEIGADAEGHTAFATLADGADAAASLLRRYVRDYGRRNALAIVRRWAPSECRVATPVRVGKGVATPAVSATLAPRGLGRTLRARFLAAHRPGGAPRARALRVQPWSPLARMAGRPGARPAAARVPRVAMLQPVPDIAAGISAEPGRAATARTTDPTALLDRKLPSPDRMVAESAQLPAIAAGLPLLDLRLPAPLCTGDEVRIQAYAARISGSVGLKPGDDLDLFGPDGTPRPNLAPVMLAMSAVELGTLRAGPDLVAEAIARLKPTTPAP